VNNKYKFTVPGTNQNITIPIEIQWDFLGRDDSIEVYEDEVLKIVAGIPEDFEVIRFAHAPYDNNNNTKTLLNYEFNFYSGVVSNVTASTMNDWNCSYLSEGFTKDDLYLLTKPFKKSFFKLDFYDSSDTTKQTLYFTIIIPSYSGQNEKFDLSSTIKNVLVKKPNYLFDYISSPGENSTNMDGFFYYWLKSRKFINVDTFYVSIKFFDAKQGVYVRMMTEPQSSLPNKFVFDNQKYFYNKVVMDYNDKTYKIYNYLGNRIGIGNPIKWYEYVNP